MAGSIYDIAHVDQMEGHEFERFIAGLLGKSGYQKVEVTPGSGDQGVDVLAEKDGVRYAFQCKCYSSDLGNTPVQEVNTGKMVYHCHVGVVVTNRCFTQSAREAAKATGVLLWDRTKLESLIAQANMEDSGEPAVQQEGESFTLWTGSSLLRRGGIALQDKEWKKASQFFDRVLNTDPENAEAYLGLMMAEAKLSNQEAFVCAYVDRPWLMHGNNFSHAKEFAGPEMRGWFAGLEKRKGKEHQHQELVQQMREEELKQAAIRLAPIRKSLKKAAFLIAHGNSHIVGLKSDGTVVAVGENSDGQCNISDWANIVAIAAGFDHTVGLRDDGTVVAAGGKSFGQCDVSDWTNIVMIATGGGHTVGLKSDGTVVAAGWNEFGQCDVSDWQDIITIAAGFCYTVGLKSNGTVVATGANKKGQCNVSSWTDIEEIVPSSGCTVGLKLDGTVVVTNSNIDEDDCSQYGVFDWRTIVAIAEGNLIGLRADGTVVGGQCDTFDWRDIVAIAAGFDHTVGLKADGTVVATGDNCNGQCEVSDWRDIAAIAAWGNETLGLRSDGTVVAVGDNSCGRSDVQNWRLFNSIDTLEQERAGVRACWETERKQRETEDADAERKQLEEIAQKRTLLETEQAKLQTELIGLKGLFTRRRRREIEARLEAIEEKQKLLK